MQRECFATFGSGQLVDYDVSPVSVILLAPYGITDSEFHAILQIRFDNKYCTIYPIEHMEEFILNYGMQVYTLQQLEDLHKTK